MIVPGERLVGVLASQQGQIAINFFPSDVAHLGWAKARLAFLHAPIIGESLCIAFMELQSFSPLHLSNTAWAYYKLAISHLPFPDCIAHASFAGADQFGSTHISSTAWAFSFLVLQ